jgi:PAS domain S-box-containing protein
MEQLRTAWLTLRSYVDDMAYEREHYLQFFERATDAYFVTDRSGRIVEVNGAAVDLLERRRVFLKGKPLAVFIAPEERRAFRSRASDVACPDRWQTCIQTRRRRTRVEISGRAIPGQGTCWRLRRVS